MNKLPIIKNSLLTAGGVTGFGFSLYLFITSFTKYTDEYGTSIDFNPNYAVLTFIFILLSGLFIYNLVRTIQNKKESGYKEIIGSVFILTSLYTLGSFFKALIKATSNGKTFDYASYQLYLYVGIVTLFISAYYVIVLYEIYVKNAKK